MENYVTKQSMLSIPKREVQISETTSNEELLCRICLEVEIFGNIISPCKCNSYVHPYCLSEWLNHKNTKICQVCLETYNVRIKKSQVLSFRSLKEQIKEDSCKVIKQIVTIVFFAILFIVSNMLLFLNGFKTDQETLNMQIVVVFSITGVLTFGIFAYFLTRFIMCYCMQNKIQFQL